MGALGVVVLLAMIAVMGGAFLVPVVAPQATCDVFAPLLCAGGERPTCGLVRSSRKGQSVAVKCPDGSGSAAAIYITAIGVAVLAFGCGLPFLVVRARRRRREAFEARLAMRTRLGTPNWR